MKQLLDSVNDLFVLKQITTAGGSSALFNGGEKALIILEHSVDSFNHDLLLVHADTGRKLREASVLL